MQKQEYFQRLGVKETFKTYEEGHTVSLHNIQYFTTMLLNSLKE